MSEVKYNFKSFLTCIEQKNILLTSLLNLTKQIEVQANQDEFNLNELLLKRQIFIDRTIKCDEIIKQQIKSFSAEQRELCEAILSSDKEKAFDSDQKKAFNLARENDALTEKIININK